jgi:phosphoglycerol transferase MdoB-like AlkP superfamily enzyme
LLRVARNDGFFIIFPDFNKDNHSMRGFNRFLLRFLNDVKQWLFFMLYLSCFRIAFISFFRNKIDPATGVSEVLLTVLNGLRYDSMVATYWVLIPFLASVASGFVNIDRFADRVRGAFGAVFIVVTAFAWVVTFGYFKEYNEQFNYLIFNLYYDDAGAILKTIWADYHPLLALSLIGAVSALSLGLKKRFPGKSAVSSETLAARPFTLLSRALLGLVILTLLVAASRGSIGRRPAQRKDAAVTKDAFLNKAVVNPYFSFLYAVQDHAQQTGLAGLESYLPDRDVRKAAQELFKNPAALADLDAYLARHAAGPKSVPPRHVFLVVMESYDAWPFLDKYALLGLTHSLSELGRNGLHFRNFVPASDGTMQSLTAIITGIPYSQVEINYQRTALQPYPSSLFETFRRLGYRTRLFYGGYLSWQRFGDFARDQGAEEIYGAPHMSKGAATHEWGVDDEYLFDFILKTVPDDRPSFNLIMTTSYHPPYNVDIRAKGFPLDRVPGGIAPLFDDTTSLRMLGHLWYSDKCIGEFVKKAESGLTRPLFALTGDHFGRKFINARPEFFERSGVPFILYGKETLRGVTMPQGAAGAHIDIGPTLVELAAPRGFTYYSVGRDLIAPRKDFLGIGWFRVIGKDFILDLAGTPQFHPLPGTALPKSLPDVNELRATFNRAYGIGWSRVKQGEKF